MIIGLKEYPKASKSVLQKAQYEQKNSSVSLKIKFKEHKELAKIYLKFKGQIKNIYGERIAIAISGGPDSLALAALAKNYSLEKKQDFIMC